MIWQYALVVAVGYLMGAIPVGWIAGKLLRGVDVRDYGSGATGATNVLRTLGPRAFLFVLVADAFKAYAPVLAIWYIFEPNEGGTAAQNLQAAAAVAAIIGHDWPVYIGFRGGRGVAATYGAFAAMLFPLSLGLVVVAILIVLTFRYMSLMSLTTIPLGGVALLVLALTGVQPYAYAVFGGLAAVLVIFRHWGNIRRLLAGTEPKMGQGGTRRTSKIGQKPWPFHRT
jgi:glycerol-3-phosphate acyltransferase PlsY